METYVHLRLYESTAIFVLRIFVTFFLACLSQITDTAQTIARISGKNLFSKRVAKDKHLYCPFITMIGSKQRNETHVKKDYLETQTSFRKGLSTSNLTKVLKFMFWCVAAAVWWSECFGCGVCCGGGGWRRCVCGGVFLGFAIALSKQVGIYAASSTPHFSPLSAQNNHYPLTHS